MKFADIFSKGRVVAFASIMMLVVSSMVPPPASSSININLNYDWVIRVETTALQRMFQYKGSALSPVTKLSLVYYPVANPDKPKPYELVWYHNGKPLGMERLGVLGLAQAEGTAIKIVNKGKPGIEEDKASASIILRLMLDTYLNRNPVVLIIVPDDSYTGIIRELKAQGAKTGAPDPNSPEMRLFTMVLQSESAGTKEILYVD